MVTVPRAGMAVPSFLCSTCDGPVAVDGEHVGMPIRCARCRREYVWQDGVVMLGHSADPDDYPEDFHGLLAEVEPRHFWFGERNRLILATMREAIGPLAGRSLLDVGCGTGFVTAALERAGMGVCGLDMNLAGLRYARRRMRGLLLCQDAARVPFSGQFDVAMLCDVIEHTPDDRSVLREASRALKPGGRLVVTVPAHPNLWTPLDDAGGHKRRYTPRTLMQAMRDAGLRVGLVRPFNTLLLPALALQRQVLKRRPTATAEQRLALVRESLRVPPRPLNDVMRLAMRADLWLSRLPGSVGASLIAVGRRVQ